MSDAFAHAPLGELCDILDKKRKPITKRNRKPGPYPYYGATGVLDHVESYIFDEPLVLIGEDGAKWGAGEETAYGISGKAWVNNHAHVLRPKREKILDSWLIYYINASDITKFITGLTVPKLNQGKLREIPVPVPPIDEQKRIVAILDEAFANIATVVTNTEKNLANARELFESQLNEVYGRSNKRWVEKAVGEIAEHCLGKMLDKSKNKGILRPYLRNLNVQWFNISTDDLLEMRIEEKEEQRYRVEKGDLVVCEGGYPGRAAIWDQDQPAFFQKALHRVRCHDSVYNHWLLYYLYLCDARNDLRRYFTGAGIQHFTGQALKKFRVPLAPVDEARELVARMEEVRQEVLSLESIQQEKLSALRELKQSLLQKAFSGELKAEKTGNEVQEAVA